MTCRDAIKEVFEAEDGVLETNQVVARVYAKYPDRPWKESTISADLIGLSVNHPSSRHYPSIRIHAFLFSLGRGRYRRYNPDRDGTWTVTDNGVELVDDSEALDEEPGDAVFESITSVSLERDLERYLVANLKQLEPGLKLYQDGDATGQQYSIGTAGRIDILAIDTQGRYVVVELKAGEADERVCGQILRYMGWVKQEIAKDQPVRGIVVANSIHGSLRYAVQAMTGVALMRYEVAFKFVTSPAPLPTALPATCRARCSRR